MSCVKDGMYMFWKRAMKGDKSIVELNEVWAHYREKMLTMGIPETEHLRLPSWDVSNEKWVVAMHVVLLEEGMPISTASFAFVRRKCAARLVDSQSTSSGSDPSSTRVISYAVYHLAQGKFHLQIPIAGNLNKEVLLQEAAFRRWNIREGVEEDGTNVVCIWEWCHVLEP